MFLRTILLLFLAAKLSAQPPRLVLPVGHTGDILAACFSPDGKKLVTASKDKTAKIWDAASGYLLAELKGKNPILSVQFSPDGKKIISSENKSGPLENDFTQIMRTWNALNGNFISSFEINEYNNSLQFSSDSKSIISISQDGDIKIIESASGKIMKALTIKTTGENNSLVLSPDGTKLLTYALNEKFVKLWDVKTGKLLFTFIGYKKELRTAQFSKNGNEILTASGYETKIWDTKTGKLIRQVTGQIDGKFHFSFSADGRIMITKNENDIGNNDLPAGKGVEVKVWNADTRKFLFTLKGYNLNKDQKLFEQDPLRSVSIDISGNKIAGVLNAGRVEEMSWVIKAGKTINIWDADNGKLIDSLTGHTGAITSLQFSRDGKKILTTSEDMTAKIWDATTGQLLADLRGYTFNSRMAHFSAVNDQAAGKRLVTASDDGTAKTWDLNTGELIKQVNLHTDKVFSAQYSSDGKKIITASQDGVVQIGDIFSDKRVSMQTIEKVYFDPTSEYPEFEDITGMIPPELSVDGKLLTAIHTTTSKVFNAADGKLLFSIKEPTEDVRRLEYARFSPDGKKIIAGWNPFPEYNYGIATAVWDAADGRLLYKINEWGTGIYSGQFSPDNKKILTISDKAAKTWDAANGNFLYDLKNAGKDLSSGHFSMNGEKILAVADHNTIKVWNAASGDILLNIEDNAGCSSAQFSPDGKKIISLSADTTTKIWDAEKGILLNKLKGHTDNLNSAQFSPDNKTIVTTSADNSVKLWDASNGKCLLTFFALDSSDYFNLLPSGYYQCTPNAARLLHYVTPDLKVISFEQFDVKYNRPDKVLESINNPDTVLINTYRNAYYKRIKKLGIDTTAFRDGYSVPETDLVNRDAISAEQKTEKLSLHIKGMDSNYKLDRFNIWVNEVPVYGQRGSSLRQDNSNSIDKIITIDLSQGENRIEASVTNVNGTESYRMPLIVNYTPAANQKEQTHFIGIGIDRFNDPQYNLNYSVKDIRDLSVKLKARLGNDIIIDTLFNENVTVQNIKALKQKLRQTTVNDKVIISYSGHGLLSKDYDYFLSTYAVNFSKPEENGLAYDELENLLDSIPARKKLMLIDACHSGEVDKDDIRQEQVNTAVMNSNQVVSRGVIVTNKDSSAKKLGLQNSFELMQNLFVNVGRNTGATIISAAAGTELALENGSLKNGVFTYAVMEAMKKYPVMKVSSLRQHIYKRVMELTNGLQKPTTRSEPVAVDWEL